MLLVLNPGWVEGFAEYRLFPALLRKAARDCPGFDDLP